MDDWNVLFSLIIQGDNSQIAALETLREEIKDRDQRIDEILNEKNSTIAQRERQFNELQITIKDRERKLQEVTEQLGEAEEKIDVKKSKFSSQKSFGSLFSNNNLKLTILSERKIV